MEDITPYARVEASRRAAETGTAWGMLFARLLLGMTSVASTAWAIFHDGPLNHVRTVFVSLMGRTFLPLWIRWAIGIPLPFVELVAGLMVLVGTRTRPALAAIAATVVVYALGGIVHDPLRDLPLQLVPKAALILYLLTTPDVLDRWSYDQWRARRNMLVA